MTSDCVVVYRIIYCWGECFFTHNVSGQKAKNNTYAYQLKASFVV